jgi:hypothetical protein
MLTKYLLPIVVMLISLDSVAQKNIEHYYNFYGAECPPADARFYSIEKKTDSGWYKTDYFISIKKIQMIGLFEDEEDLKPNGTFYWYYPNGAIESTGKFVHGKKTGTWLYFYPDKSIRKYANYENDLPEGTTMSWYNNGTLRDSLDVDKTGNGIYISWFDNGNPSSAGRYTEFYKQQGKWQYFHKDGNLSSLEIYHLDTLIDKNYFDEQGNPMADTTSTDRGPEFPGGDKAWKKYFDKNVYYPEGYEFKNGFHAEVTVKATVNEEGKIIDYWISLPLNDAFDKAALGLFDQSPNWEPAISHNRKVYSTITRTINFSEY